MNVNMFSGQCITRNLSTSHRALSLLQDEGGIVHVVLPRLKVEAATAGKRKHARPHVGHGTERICVFLQGPHQRLKPTTLEQPVSRSHTLHKQHIPAL